MGLVGQPLCPSHDSGSLMVRRRAFGEQREGTQECLGLNFCLRLSSSEGEAGSVRLGTICSELSGDVICSNGCESLQGPRLVLSFACVCPSSGDERSAAPPPKGVVYSAPTHTS